MESYLPSLDLIDDPEFLAANQNTNLINSSLAAAHVLSEFNKAIPAIRARINSDQRLSDSGKQDALRQELTGLATTALATATKCEQSLADAEAKAARLEAELFGNQAPANATMAAETRSWFGTLDRSKQFELVRNAVNSIDDAESRELLKALYEAPKIRGLLDDLSRAQIREALGRHADPVKYRELKATGLAARIGRERWRIVRGHIAKESR